MATYDELRTLLEDSDVINKTENATADVCNDILTAVDTDANGYDDTNHLYRANWAANTVNAQGVRNQAKALLWPILVANQGSSVAQIKDATVAQFKNNLKAVIIEYTNVMGA